MECANCKKELEKNTQDDIKRMKKECIGNFGKEAAETEQDIVCDDCYKKIMKWYELKMETRDIKEWADEIQQDNEEQQ